MKSPQVMALNLGPESTDPNMHLNYEFIDFVQEILWSRKTCSTMMFNFIIIPCIQIMMSNIDKFCMETDFATTNAMKRYFCSVQYKLIYIPTSKQIFK